MTNPVEVAVLPLKVEAVDRAEKEAVALIERVIKSLEEVNWDQNLVAPYPRSTRIGQMEFLAKSAKWRLYGSLTQSAKTTYGMNDPDIRKRSPKNEEKFIKEAKEDAAAQYDAFVKKLVHKVGTVDSASLAGSHVWGYSILTVTKGAVVERWQTHQIVNQSKLGKLFNQWPTRKLKG